MTTVIRVENLGKKYRIQHQQRERYTALRDVIAHRAKSLFRSKSPAPNPQSPSQEDFWALKDVSFEIKQGDIVGIIGRNGAGKSTLLKVLSRITEPTTGRVAIKGRIASLLEVGTGFHPELTGRENIYLNGAILGMSRAEVARKFDEIVDFAEIEKFLDTPVKRYSSGMYMRLAFAVAAHLEPEILVVDEVLAVGDAKFQKKCLGKMGEVAKQGRTILFVSHNMLAVKKLCPIALMLKNGELASSGESQVIINRYLSDETASHFSVFVCHDEGDSSQVLAKINSVRLLGADGQIVERGIIDQPLVVEVDYSAISSNALLNLSLAAYFQDDTYVFSSPSYTDKLWYQKPHYQGRYKSTCVIPANTFNVGTYSFSIFLVENGVSIAHSVEKLVSIEMIEGGKSASGYYGYWGGVVRPTLYWETSRLP